MKLFVAYLYREILGKKLGHPRHVFIKEGIGIFECQSFLFDLAEIIHPVDLPDLDLLFTKEEIDQAVKDMPFDHAPGHDGFNGFFMRKCRSVIVDDFYRLCDSSWHGNVDLSCINNSFITLIPKK